MSTTSATFEQSVRFFQQDGRLPENTFISLLADREFANMDVRVIASKTPVELAVELKRTALEHYPDNEVLDIAKAILQRLKDDCGVTPSAASSPQQPLEVKVQFPEQLADFSLRKLFEATVDTDRRSEVLALIKQHPDVVKAARKTDAFVIVISGKIDAGLTLEYVTLLGKQYSSAQREFKGHRPTTLEGALGGRSRPVIHPLTGEPVEGQDAAGFDYTLISEELHLALLWAKATSHSFWDNQMNVFTFGEEVTAATLSRRWAEILKDYRAAKADGETSTEGLSRYWSQKQAVATQQQVTRNPWQIQPDVQRHIGRSTRSSGKTEQDWKVLLEEAAGKVWSPNSFGQKPRHKVVMGLQITEFDTNLNGVVSLGPVVLRSFDTKGTVYILSGTDFVDRSYDNGSVNVVECGTYAELARHAGLG
jgi:hypothetical protein